MEPVAIARANFELEAKQIEAKINAILGNGDDMYAWHQGVAVNGMDYISANDSVHGFPLFAGGSAESVQLVPGTTPPVEERSECGDSDMHSAVGEVMEALSPRSSLRISKEMIKNELSSWIMSIEEEIDEKGERDEEVRASRDSNVIVQNVFAYLDPPRNSAHDLSMRSMTSGSDSRVTVEKGVEDDEDSELGFFRLAEENTEDAIEYHRNHIGNDEEDEVNLGEDHDVNMSHSGSEEEEEEGEEEEGEDGEEEEVYDDAVPGPSLLAVAAASNVRMEEIGGSVSISLNAVDTTAVESAEPSSSLSVDTHIAESTGQIYGRGRDIVTTTASTDFSVYVSDSDDSSSKRAPVKSLTPEDVLQLEEEEQWLEAAIAERIAFLRQ